MRSGLDCWSIWQVVLMRVGRVVCRLIGHRVRYITPTHGGHCVRCWYCIDCERDERGLSVSGRQYPPWL